MECLMLLVILGIVSASTGQALIAVAKNPRQTDSALADETSLISKMEQMRSVDFDSLTIGTNVAPFSDAVRVDIAYADPTGGASPSVNWKQITVRMGSARQLVTTVCKP